jgi:ATP-dependent Clp protease ATP-binding subunit ClpA
MLERFTDRAHKVLALASKEARRFNHEYIDTEHILLGLVMEGTGVGATVLKNLHIDLRKVRVEVETRVKSGPFRVTMGKMPEALRAKKVIEYAIEEGRLLGRNYVGTEHLLLGMLRETEGMAAQVLMNMGLKLEEVREELLELLGVCPADHTSSDGIEGEGRFVMFERFDDSARKVMALANQEAMRLNHEYIGTEHLLLGLVKEGAGIGAKVLEGMGIDLPTARREVEKFAQPGTTTTLAGKLPYTPRSKNVVNFAIKESLKLRHGYVGTGHLLLGLLRERDGLAFQVILKLGGKAEEIRESVLHWMSVQKGNAEEGR